MNSMGSSLGISQNFLQDFIAFFGETLIGSKMPNLTYMLVFENMAAREKNWAAFVSDPEWKKLSTTPGYTDAEIVSNISNVFLRPTAYSQI